MIRAWRRPDGLYRVTFPKSQPGTDPRELRRRRLAWHGVEVGPDEWLFPEFSVGLMGAEKMYGVVTGPSSCGFEPAGFRWATASEVEAGRTTEKRCPNCSGKTTFRVTAPGIVYLSPPPDVFHRCDIIDVCGEADVAEAVYDAEFSGKVEAMR